MTTVKRKAPAISDEAEAKIQASIAADPDSSEMTEADFSRARPFAEAFPEMAASIRKREPARTKEAVSIRLDIDVVEKLKATGPGWQSRVNDVVRDWLEKAS